MQGQLAAHDCGGIWRPFRVMSRCAHLSTLRHFDTKLVPGSKTGPLIPCERRLGKMEISEIQEVTFDARFGNRD